MARHIRKGDVVYVNAGKFKGKTGKVLEVLVDKDRVRVEGIAGIKRHLKPGRDPKVPQGGIIEKFGTVHISNVQPIDPSTNKPTRVGFKTLEDGRKVRVARKSGETLTESR
jgi:large subunit ribosomal protein L24